MKCINCGKKLTGKQRKYCSKKCAERFIYRNNKKKYKENLKRWQKENPEKTKEIHRKAYEKYRTVHRERFNKICREAMRKRNNIKPQNYRV